MQLRDIGTELFLSFVDFDADVSFIYQVMEINDDVRQLLALQDVLKGVNMEFMEEWERLQMNASVHRLSQQEAGLIRHVVLTLQECERDLEYLRETTPDNGTCPKCGKPYPKEPEQAKESKKDPKKVAKKEDKNRH